MNNNDFFGVLPRLKDWPANQLKIAFMVHNEFPHHKYPRNRDKDQICVDWGISLAELNYHYFEMAQAYKEKLDWSEKHHRQSVDGITFSNLRDLWIRYKNLAK